MTWGRFGDSLATHPIVLRGATVSGADERTLHELLGVALRLASLSAQHETDYVVSWGTVAMVCGSQMDRLIGQLAAAGYISEIEQDGEPAWRIVDDPELIHLRLREEVEWDRRRKRDNGNVDLTVQVMARDGSACRICGRSVNWNDRRGTRGGTYDHRVTPATTPDDIVVACKGCNSARGQAAANDLLEQWDREHPLLPVPQEPHYCDHAKARLAKYGLVPEPDEERPAGQADNAPRPRNERDTATSTRPGNQPDNAKKDNGSAKPGGSGSRVRKSTSPGRDGPGSGRSGKGRNGSGSDAAPNRRRRGKRGGSGPGARPTGGDAQ